MNKITLGIVAAVFSASANASWSIVDLGKSVFAESINDSGQITGSINYNSETEHVFISDANGENIRDISSTGSLSIGREINNSGQILGVYLNLDSKSWSNFITEKNGNGMADLSTVGGLSGGTFDGINDSGQVIGGYASDNVWRSYIVDTNTSSISQIGSLSGSDTFATAINNSGQVVGYSASADGRNHAFITSSDGKNIKDIGTLDDKFYIKSHAFDINESGQVVGGSSREFGFFSQAFITGDNGEGMINLGTLGGRAGAATAVNDEGLAIGASTLSMRGNEYNAFIYAGGGLTNLTTLPELVHAGWTDIVVTDINNHNQIVGYGDLNNELHSFLLSFTSDTVFTPQDLYIPPIPEPSTYLMLLAGLGLLGFVGKYRLK